MNGNPSLNSLLTTANTGLIQAQNLIVGANQLAGAGVGTAVDANFTTPFTSASSLTSANVAEIGTDIAASANTGQLELTLCVQIDQTANPSDNTSTAVGKCMAASSPQMAAAVAAFTGTVQPGVASAAAGWDNLNSLATVSALDPTDFPGGLFTVDGDVSVSSAATVTGIGKPTAYSTTFKVSGPAATGFVIPSGFTLTFPANFGVNVKLVSAEIQQSQVANPPMNMAIGTASVTSPEIAALVPGSKGVDSTAKVFVVATASLTQPQFEVYLGQGDYILGTLTGVTFPLTVNFGQPIFNGKATPLPVSAVSMTFPASTSPLLAKSCSDLGSLTGTMTDAVSSLAPLFGDNSDTGALPMSSTPTVVTNLCAPGAAASISGIKNGKPTLRVRLKGNGGTPFTSETLTLPNGIAAKGLKAKSLKVTGAKVKSVSAKGRKLTINFRSATKSATVSVKAGLVATSKLMKAVARHKTKSLTIGYTVRYAPANATAANSTIATVTVKKLS